MYVSDISLILTKKKEKLHTSYGEAVKASPLKLSPILSDTDFDLPLQNGRS